MATLTATPQRTTTARTHTPGRVSRVAGRVLTALVIAFLAFDVVGKVLAPPSVVEPTLALGFDASFVPVMGVLLAIGVVLYAVPRTAFLGAVWTTAYLGGAVCANVINDQPLVGFVLAPVYTAVLMWAALWLRSERLRSFVLGGV